MTSDRPRAWNSTLPVRATGLPRGNGLARTENFPGGKARFRTGKKTAPGSGIVVPLRRPSPSLAAAFSPKVRGLIHGRSYGACEACGVPLPGGKGQCQHRVARGMGGSRNPVLGSAANGTDLCGTPASGCHGLCEARDEGMHAMGFWLWSWENPLAVPIMLHSPGGSGVTVYLTTDGRYSTEPPQDGAA